MTTSSKPNGTQPLSFVKPPSARLLEQGLHELVVDEYGPFVGWEALGGEDDLNIRVTRAHGDVFLKVSWVDDFGFADFQTELTDYLSRQSPELPVPAIIPAISGARSIVSEQLTERPIHLRMTTFLEGRSARGVTLDPMALHAVGQVLARLDGALADLGEDAPNRPTNWNLLAAHDVLADLISENASGREGDSRLWGAVLDDFVATTLPRLAAWPAQLIHNDLNGSNLLLHAPTGEVTGIFDFGDVVSAPRVVDLAVAAAYLIDGSSSASLCRSLSAIVAGYQSHAPLSADEVAIIPEIMRARYAMALALNHARARTSDDPAYVQYVLRNAETSRAKLAVLTDAGSAQLAQEVVDSQTVSRRARHLKDSK